MYNHQHAAQTQDAYNSCLPNCANFAISANSAEESSPSLSTSSSENIAEESSHSSVLAFFSQFNINIENSNTENFVRAAAVTSPEVRPIVLQYQFSNISFFFFFNFPCQRVVLREGRLHITGGVLHATYDL